MVEACGEVFVKGIQLVLFGHQEFFEGIREGSTASATGKPVKV